MTTAEKWRGQTVLRGVAKTTLRQELKIWERPEIKPGWVQIVKVLNDRLKK